RCAVVLHQLLLGEGRLADHEVEVGVLVHTEFDPAALNVGDGLGDVHGHRSGARVRHEPAGTEHAAEPADLTHEVGGRNGNVEVGVTAGDFLNEFVAADFICTRVDRLLGALTGCEDQDPRGLTGSVGQVHGAAYHLAGLAGVHPEPEHDASVLAAVPRRSALHQPPG